MEAVPTKDSTAVDPVKTIIRIHAKDSGITLCYTNHYYSHDTLMDEIQITNSNRRWRVRNLKVTADIHLVGKFTN